MPDGGDSRYIGYLNDLKDMHILKGEDYGDCGDPYASLRSCEEMGVPAWKVALIRANEKMRRAKVWVQRGKLVNEGIRDTLLDLASYTIAALVFLGEEADKS